MWGYLRHSICAATTFKNFLIVPLKARIFEKLEPCTGYKTNLWSGATGKKDFDIDRTMLLKIVAFKWTIRTFLYIVAAHIEGLRQPLICLFETLFSCQCPFKSNPLSLEPYSISFHEIFNPRGSLSCVNLNPAQCRMALIRLGFPFRILFFVSRNTKQSETNKLFREISLVSRNNKNSEISFRFVSS
jgi:hypothetical protein